MQIIKPINIQYNNITIVYDIFIINNKLYLFLPIISKYNLHKIPNIHIKQSNILLKKHIILHATINPIIIITCPIHIGLPLNFTIICKILNTYITREIVLNNQINISRPIALDVCSNIINSNNTVDSTKYKLGISTLFKDDYLLFTKYYEYYKALGVNRFYMYYNGIVTPEIAAIFDKPDVILVEWNYTYRCHHNNKYFAPIAQIMQMNAALYKYGKPECEYMAFCDLDEYMYIPSDTTTSTNNTSTNTQPTTMLITKLDDEKQNKNINIFAFNNIFCTNESIPWPIILSNVTLDTRIQYNYPIRSKCIYRTANVYLLDVHAPNIPSHFTTPYKVIGEFWHFNKCS